jgi:tRNA-binding protein
VIATLAREFRPASRSPLAPPDPTGHCRSRKQEDVSVSDQISFDDFLKVDVRVGKVVEAEEFPEARKPAYKMKIDFGPDIGIKKTSAQITRHYTPEALVGKLVMAVVNFPPRQIGPVMSEVLTLGVPDDDGEVVLLTPDKDVPIGGRLY